MARCFELRTLSDLGYAPVLDRCVLCGRRDPGAVALSASAGGVVCEKCFPSASDGMAISARGLKALRALSRRQIEAASAPAIPPEVHREIARVWAAFLEGRIERPLRSAEFSRALTNRRDSRQDPE